MDVLGAEDELDHAQAQAVAFHQRVRPARDELLSVDEGAVERADLLHHEVALAVADDAGVAARDAALEVDVREIDVRPLVVQAASTTAAHEAGDGERITVAELLAVYRIDEAQCHPAPTTIWIMDDVLTAGTHYRAMHHVLAARFPGVPIYGVFLARRVFANDVEG